MYSLCFKLYTNYTQTLHSERSKPYIASVRKTIHEAEHKPYTASVRKTIHEEEHKPYILSYEHESREWNLERE